MKTTSEILQEALLDGRHLNKFDFLSLTGSVCLAQRILELRQMGWNIRDKSIPGKGNLHEYWLESEEIAKIKMSYAFNIPKAVLEEENEVTKQIDENLKNIAETSQKEVEIEKYEQMGFGLLGGHNY